MRALTGLRQAGLAVQNNEDDARPNEMALTRIHLDPGNTRRQEDENTSDGIEAQRELTLDIRSRGVKSPISLRPHPTIPGEYMINFGHRRFKGAVDAGLATIPYFLDVTFDSYDQVKENLLHRKPSVWALAEFVRCRLDEKQSKAEISERLGKSNQNFVTELLALVDAPSCLHRAYMTGVKSTRTLYDLRRAYDEFPEKIEQWCTTEPKITRDTIQAVLEQLRQAKPGASGANLEGSHGKPSSTLTRELQDQVLAKDIKTESAGADNAVKRLAQHPHEARVPTTPNIRKPPDERTLRHDVKTSEETESRMALQRPAKDSVESAHLRVQYKGKSALIAPNATLAILVTGANGPFEVPVSELIFMTSDE